MVMKFCMKSPRVSLTLDEKDFHWDTCKNSDICNGINECSFDHLWIWKIDQISRRAKMMPTMWALTYEESLED